MGSKVERSAIVLGAVDRPGGVENPLVRGDDGALAELRSTRSTPRTTVELNNVEILFHNISLWRNNRHMARAGRLPTACPSCGGGLRVVQLACPDCGTTVQGDYLLPALSRLGREDQEFALAFILHSGSLKEMARLYGVSYPTVRNRLDDLIARLGATIEPQAKDTARNGDGGGTDAGDDR